MFGHREIFKYKGIGFHLGFTWIEKTKRFVFKIQQSINLNGAMFVMLGGKVLNSFFNTLVMIVNQQD